MQASKLVMGSLLAKNNFFAQFWTENFASSRMASCGSGLLAEWPFRNQNAIDASDSPLLGGLRVKRLITHALCDLPDSDIVTEAQKNGWHFTKFFLKCVYYLTHLFSISNPQGSILVWGINFNPNMDN